MTLLHAYALVPAFSLHSHGLLRNTHFLPTTIFAWAAARSPVATFTYARQNSKESGNGFK
jgi:hypothetical protein